MSESLGSRMLLEQLWGKWWLLAGPLRNDKHKITKLNNEAKECNCDFWLLFGKP